jgi:hypothetical protein
MAAASLTAVLLTALLVAVVLLPRTPRMRTPEECLDLMFQAMKAGDVPAYLDCFSGELREQLDANVRQQGVNAFSRYLMDTVAPIKGRAVFGAEYASPVRVRLKVDRVYEARPWECQGYWLERRLDVWRIYAIDMVELHDASVPYGTPAHAAPEQPSNASGQ